MVLIHCRTFPKRTKIDMHLIHLSRLRDCTTKKQKGNVATSLLHTCLMACNIFVQQSAMVCNSFVAHLFFCTPLHTITTKMLHIIARCDRCHTLLHKWAIQWCHSLVCICTSLQSASFPFCLLVCSVFVCVSYVVHHFNGTGLHLKSNFDKFHLWSSKIYRHLQVLISVQLYTIALCIIPLVHVGMFCMSMTRKLVIIFYL